MTPRTQHGPARAERHTLRARLRSGSHWTAHFATLTAVITSCVVSNPPEYSSAEQTPPLLVLLDADPLVGKVVGVPVGERLSLNVPVRSEDAPGDELIARLYLDYGNLETEEVQAPLVLLPRGSYDDVERRVEMTWVVPQLQPGCRQLSLVVTHRSNLDPNGRPLDNRDTAVAVWWLNVSDTNSDNPMSDCITQAFGQ